MPVPLRPNSGLPVSSLCFQRQVLPWNSCYCHIFCTSCHRFCLHALLSSSHVIVHSAPITLHTPTLLHYCHQPSSHTPVLPPFLNSTLTLSPCHIIKPFQTVDVQHSCLSLDCLSCLILMTVSWIAHLACPLPDMDYPLCLWYNSAPYYHNCDSQITIWIWLGISDQRPLPALLDLAPGCSLKRHFA